MSAEYSTEQNLRLSQQLLAKQGEINRLTERAQQAEAIIKGVACFLVALHERVGEESLQLRGELERLRQRAEHAEGITAHILSRFSEAGHPGKPCHRTGWISDRQIAEWRATLEGHS